MKRRFKRLMYLALSLVILATAILGSAVPALANTGVPLSSLSKGDLVSFAGYRWEVLDPGTGYLLMDGFCGAYNSINSMPVHEFDTSGNRTFDPSSSTNIAYYLNNDLQGFYQNLSPADQALIQTHSWTTGDENHDTDSTTAVSCKIGLLSYSEYNSYTSNGTDFSVIGSVRDTKLSGYCDGWWTRTPSSLSGYVWHAPNDAPLEYKFPNYNAFVRPALYLNPGVKVSGSPSRYAYSTAAVIDHHAVSVLTNSSWGGTFTGGGAYANGDSVPVTATPNRGYNFINWTDENGALVSSSPSYSFTMGTADKILVANFQKAPVITVVNGEPFTVTVYNTYGALTGTANSTYGTLTGTASGDNTVISGTLTGVPATPKYIALGSGTIEIKAVSPPSTTLDNSKSFY